MAVEQQGSHQMNMSCYCYCGKSRKYPIRGIHLSRCLTSKSHKNRRAKCVPSSCRASPVIEKKGHEGFPQMEDPWGSPRARWFLWKIHLNLYGSMGYPKGNFPWIPPWLPDSWALPMQDPGASPIRLGCGSHDTGHTWQRPTCSTLRKKLLHSYWKWPSRNSEFSH